MPYLKQKTRKVGGPNYVSKSSTIFNTVQRSTKDTATSYIGSIMYPGSVQGVKVPDFNLYPTVTAHTETEGTFSCSAAGNGGILVRLHAGQGPGTVAGAGGAINVQDPATTTDLAFTYLAVQNVRTNPAAFNASYKYGRLVSASLECQYVGNDNNNSGRIVQGVLVKDEYLAASFPSFTSVLSSRDNMCASVSQGAYLRYRPVDESSFDFVDMAIATRTDEQGAFIVAVNACGAGAPFRWKLSCNWECIIRSDAFDQPIANMAEVGASDPQAFNAAKSALVKIPSTSLLNTGTITKNDNNPDAAKKTAWGVVGQFINNYAQGRFGPKMSSKNSKVLGTTAGRKLGQFMQYKSDADFNFVKGLTTDALMGASAPMAKRYVGGGRAVARQPMIQMEPFTWQQTATSRIPTYQTAPGPTYSVPPTALGSRVTRVGRLQNPPPRWQPPPWRI